MRDRGPPCPKEILQSLVLLFRRRDRSPPGDRSRSGLIPLPARGIPAVALVETLAQVPPGFRNSLRVRRRSREMPQSTRRIALPCETSTSRAAAVRGPEQHGVLHRNEAPLPRPWLGRVRPRLASGLDRRSERSQEHPSTGRSGGPAAKRAAKKGQSWLRCTRRLAAI